MSYIFYLNLVHLLISFYLYVSIKNLVYHRSEAYSVLSVQCY